MPKQALGWLFPLGLGLVVEDKPTELSCIYTVCVQAEHKETQHQLHVYNMLINFDD